MFPIRDHNPSSRTPVVTYLLIASNILVFMAILPSFADEPGLMRLFYSYALIPTDLTNGGSWQPLFSSMFLHAGLLHLGGNMLFLWIFGDNMEDAFGPVGFLIFYLACGIGAGLAHVAIAPNSAVPTVGASGAIAGVLGGYLLLFPRARVDVILFFLVFFKVIPVPAWLTLGLWFALQIFNGIATESTGGGVAYWAHVGGFAFGLAFTLPLLIRRGWTQTGRPAGTPKLRRIEDRFSKSDVPTVRRRR